MKYVTLIYKSEKFPALELSLLPLAHDLAVHLEFFMIVALHHQHDMLTYHEVCILVLIGVVAHAGHTVREVAENTSAVFAGDHRKATVSAA